MTPEQAAAAIDTRRRRTESDPQAAERIRARQRAQGIAKTALIGLHSQEFEVLYDVAVAAEFLKAGLNPSRPYSRPERSAPCTA